ncbi:MAG: cell division topological specificity factor MinE [Clostridia bacterium]|nr:cell division topological specificity factor MinE [Clostridia bacterium]
MKLFKKVGKKEEKDSINNSRDAAKERLHLVLMQDRANVSVDFLELMKQEIIDVIKKYIDIDENAIDVKLTNQENEDGTNGAPALYANIPIINIKNEARKLEQKNEKHEKPKEKEEKEEEPKKENNKEKSKSVKKQKSKQETKKESKSNIEENEITEVSTQNDELKEEIKEESQQEITENKEKNEQEEKDKSNNERK